MSTQARLGNPYTQEPTMKELRSMSEVELLQTHRAVIDVLIRRGVVKTRNNPIGDYTEWLVCRRLKLRVQGNSQAAYDAIDREGIRYQIKGRCDASNAVQLGVIRNLDQHGFDFLVALVFNEDYSIRLAVKVSYEAVRNLARFRRHQNGHILTLNRSTVDRDGVDDILHLIS